MMRIDDTIAAVSTPRGKGGVALIRISGAEALQISERVFFPASGKKLSDLPPRQTVYGEIRMPGEEKEPVDDGMGVVFRAPRSFTGEDTVEITCHGGVLVTESVLSALFLAGARPAEAGEFTRRAFVNGKLKLCEAEALGTLLEARTYGQLRLSRGGMTGRLSRRVNEIGEKLRHLLASAYAKIDYPEEDLADLSDAEMRDSFLEILSEVRRLSDTYRTGHATMEGVRTVISGPANAGKSSLYNAMVGREAAIVTDVAGTTRDLLSETVGMGNVTLCLYDTAGLRETSDRVEQIGIARAREAIETAELVLAVFDASGEVESEAEELLDLLRDRRDSVMILLNKSDLAQNPTWQEATSDFPEVSTISLRNDEEGALILLKDRIEAKFTDGTLDLQSDAVVANARQYAALKEAEEALLQAADAIRAGLSADLYCLDAEAALSALFQLDGREVGEEIVSEIFSKFCVGK